MRQYQPVAITFAASIGFSVLLWLLLATPVGERDTLTSTARRTATSGKSATSGSASESVELLPTKRVAWTGSKVKGSPEPPPPFRAENAFPSIRFKNPVALEVAPGTNRIWVAEQSGKLFSFERERGATQADLALDVVDLTRGERPAAIDNSAVKGLEALYGLTFHPKFAENRYCYLCYVVRGDSQEQLPAGTRVSRFRVTETSPPQLDPASEQIVITWLQGGHNGGCLAFGADGCLYISTGDGGFANPPDGRNAGQDLSNLLSSVLRIDVDHPDEGRAYSIPRDNPFVELAGARGEIWCYGLRNPWKMSFDRQTGDLWVADVGWELWELVYRAVKGGNYGWSVVEGRQPVHPERKVGPTPILPPTIEIPHTDGVSVTGGFVYRGKKFPELVGTYLFGDWETRRIWGARWNEQTKSCSDRVDVVEPTVRLVSFAEDPDGELYLLDYDDGTIHELVRNEPRDSNQQFPTRLSETGLFASTSKHQPAPGVLPFEVNVPQWSDGAMAERFIALPDRSSVRIAPQKTAIAGSMFSSSLTFPKDSVLVKTLSLEQQPGDPTSRRRVETQLLHFDGNFWRGYSYAWNDAQDDAELVEAVGRDLALGGNPAAGSTISLAANGPSTWHFASRVECVRCHNQWAEYALGFQVSQLQRGVGHGARHTNQLELFTKLGAIEWQGVQPSAQGEMPDAAWFAQHFVRLSDPYDPREPLDARARSYLHANCAHCHRLGGGGTAYIELQRELALDATKTLDVRPTQGTFDLPDARIIAPGDPYRSTLFYRVSKTGSGRMPHVGSEVVDSRAVRLLGEWIQQLPARRDDVVLIDKLRALEDAPADEARRKQRAAERIKLIDQLLASPDKALRTAYSLDNERWPASLRTELIAAAMARDNPLIRDLFERFLPTDQRVRRLGAVIRPGQIMALTGDADRGRDLFEKTGTISCKNCHRVGEVGGKLGPDLSRIGAKYQRPALLEQLLEPSKIIDPKYVSYLIHTTDGRTITGLLTDRTDREFVLRDAKDQVVRIAASDVETIAPQRQSLMPDLLLRDMTAQQVADLLAFLEGLK